MTKVRSSWTSTCRGGRSPKDGRCPPAPTTYPRTRSAGRQIRIPIYKITSSPKLQPSAGAYRAFGRFYPRLQPFRSHSGASGFWAFAVIIECVSFSPEFAISPIEPMVSRKCSSAEREFLAIACGQTLELKKNGSHHAPTPESPVPVGIVDAADQVPGSPCASAAHCIAEAPNVVPRMIAIKAKFRKLYQLPDIPFLPWCI